MDEVKRPKTFSAWIIPGVIVAPFMLTKEPMHAIIDIHRELCVMYGVDKYLLFIKPQPKGARKSIGSTEDIAYLRQMLIYFMKDVYKDDVTLNDLRKYLGLKTHSTVSLSIKAYSNYIEIDARIPKKLGDRSVRWDYKQFNEIIRPWL